MLIAESPHGNYSRRKNAGLMPGRGATRRSGCTWHLDLRHHARWLPDGRLLGSNRRDRVTWNHFRFDVIFEELKKSLLPRAPIALPGGHERLPRKYACGVVPSIVRNILFLPACTASVASSSVRSVILTDERFLHFQLRQDKMSTRPV